MVSLPGAGTPVVPRVSDANTDARGHLLETRVADWIALHAASRPESIAIVHGERRVTWAELHARASRVANALASIGFKRGDKVALLAPNSVEAIEVLLGTMRAGGVIVPLSALLMPDVLLGLIDDSDASVLFVGAPYGDQVTKIRPRLRNVAAASIVGVGSAETDLVDYEALLARVSPEDPRVPILPDDDCNIIYSSGTTGVPKGIVHTHFSRSLFALGLGLQLRIDETAVTLVTTPLYTNGTWMTLLPTLGMGGTTVLMRGFDASTFLDLVERERITHVFMVPTQLSLVLRDPEFDARDLSSLRITISSGSRLPPETKKEILTRMTRGLLELYGMSEGIGTVLEPEYMEAKLASVGRPIPGTEIRIIDELDRELPVGSIGEIVGSSPSVTRGYYKKPAETRALGWTAPDGQPFIRTGDIGRLDEDGFLYVLDRKKDMIISGGINVYASDLEDIFSKHPDVLEVAVIAVAHEKWGETPVAVVVPREGARANADEIRHWANERLSKHQRAERVELARSLPRNALGKVLKRELRDRYSSGS